MDYKTLSVKTFIEDMNGKEIMMKTVPSLTKYPLKLFYKKTVISYATDPLPAGRGSFFACLVYITLIFALKRKKPD